MNIRAVVVLVSVNPPSASLNCGAIKTYQDVHRYLRGHDQFERFRLTVDLDIGRRSRDLACIFVEAHAARRVEPHLLEAIEEVRKAIEQAAFPFR